MVTSQAAYEIQKTRYGELRPKLHSPHEASRLDAIYRTAVLHRSLFEIADQARMYEMFQTASYYSYVQYV